MNILTKILKNNEDKIEIKFLVLDTFFLLNAHKMWKFGNKSLVQTTVSVGTRKHVHDRISAWTKILYIRQPSAQATQTTLSTT